MVLNALSRSASKVFGSRNDRLIKSYRKRVDRFNELEPAMRKLTDIELRARTTEFRERRAKGEKLAELLPEVMATAREVMDRYVGIRGIFNPANHFDPSRLPDHARKRYDDCLALLEATQAQPVPGGDPAPPWLCMDVPVELYDAVRELYPESRPPFRARPFDVQLIGGMVLGEGRIAEMRTGEGKTIVGPLACYAACVDSLSCHVVTVNDYLVQRDRDWVFPFYFGLGLTVGAIHPQHMQPPQLKAQAYSCDVVYGTNAEFGFDYLRDNMKMSAEAQVQKRRDFCIIDEVDSILIDEARTPLIISGPARQDQRNYALADQLARHLMDRQQEWNAANKKVEKTELRIKGLEGDIRTGRDKGKAAAMREEIKKLMPEMAELERLRDRHTQFYEVEMQRKAAHLTHEGVSEAQKVAGIGSFYVGNNMDMPHLLENALRAHAVYQADKDYVVKDGEVVIVDENTGRLMVGRQWSDGLHQAVEAKEKVKIKEETQTLATVTIQNFFKLYKRLAGMTGTAITEATEFMEIYTLEVVAIPTNVPIARDDRNDLIFMGEKDKWEAILDEIKRVHDLGRPVLVGTTSVEKSEMLSNALKRKYNVQHSVLNAKQHERESKIVEDAGELAAVMIATNMAGRGTDIKLQPVAREALIDHWKRRDLLPASAGVELSDEELVAASYRHQAKKELGLSKSEAQAIDGETARLQLMRKWLVDDAFFDESKAKKMDAAECEAQLDQIADYQRHRLQVWPHIEAMGGLHIVGTERHESRRIDNQLRGRAGRQGDRGSSRFFLSLEDSLMQMFAGDRTKMILSRLGMKEGDAIEHGMVSRSVERAQKKVEERNYQIRKNLLDYDEVMEYQRSTFYSLRQDVLESRDIPGLIFEYIGEAVEEAGAEYLDPIYVPTQAAEWVRQNLDASVEPARLNLENFDELESQVRKAAASEAQSVVDVTLGEYMSDDIAPDDWDLKGLQSWAMSRFDVNLSQNKLRQSNPHEVRQTLIDAALEQIEKKDLTPLQGFSNVNAGAEAYSHWASQKFGIEVKPETLSEMPRDAAADHMLQQARAAYRRRELTYPIEYAMTAFTSLLQQDHDQALRWLYGWTVQRFALEWTPEKFTQEMSGETIAEKLVKLNEDWLAPDGGLDQEANAKAAELANKPQELRQYLADRFGMEVTPDEVEAAPDLPAFIRRKAREGQRSDLTQLEQYVLLQILDQAWKDHLYAMDQMKDSINLRGYAERDPKIEYKREGANLFREMQAGVKDRVTELIFRARLTPQVQLQSRYGDDEDLQAVRPDDDPSAASGAGDTPVATAGAAHADGEDQAPRAPRSRKARRAAASRDRRDTGESNTTSGGPAKPARKKRR